mmetsp:Transcript_35317/g.53087  ORF Transcript_35317/g.53087 Transcript_35317/m.53087 type:complete len:255 (+) Transcript_35317:72-836(+)|eukprot:CAMPEP_0206469940 /NCGR_PEP_ID=MMETSP0324_2-20121206/30601_1 /ASSEMBLY_ACC=CAM_ASM_000836 /TAXON_ID=2866 /ORGANISM="Crypthecodinium cohnii, Strain Seligo" /LENGTH=254 /DNA_ID=CAMNT_0053943839 /DNA_START=71 /DNA_END=835 /DNA_ORIENTATION=+
MSCHGKVKSFNDGKGWGFLSYDGHDVFVHIKDCKGGKPEPGDEVRFDLDPDRAANGQKKAINVQGGTGLMEACRKPQGQMQGFGGGKGGKGGHHRVGGGGGAMPGAHTGRVKSFHNQNGWGFIDFQGQDVFLHVRECVGTQPQQGDIVTFNVEDSPSKPGQLRATNVTGGTGWPTQGPHAWSGGKGQQPPTLDVGAAPSVLPHAASTPWGAPPQMPPVYGACPGAPPIAGGMWSPPGWGMPSAPYPSMWGGKGW